MNVHPLQAGRVSQRVIAGLQRGRQLVLGGAASDVASVSKDNSANGHVPSTPARWSPRQSRAALDSKILRGAGIGYSAVAPDSRTTVRHFSNSFCVNCPSMADVPPTGFAPS